MLQELTQLREGTIQEQIDGLLSLFDQEAPVQGSEAYVVFASLVQQIVEDMSVSIHDKMSFFEQLNLWGDPRLFLPSEESYWCIVRNDGVNCQVGRYLVTMKEWLAFLESEYDNDEHWSEEGLYWKSKRRITWQELASSPDSLKYVFDNHPVVGVSWYEAEAFATCHGARLMDGFERTRLMRGPEKRRYPWGASFKQGYANTEEVALNKTSPVGVFPKDQTPEGVFDLAGNVAEWLSDDLDSEQKVIHPGCWMRDSISTWAKASEFMAPNARVAFLGFRLIRD